MKKIIPLLSVLIVMAACNKENDETVEMVSATDLAATAGITSELVVLGSSLDSLIASHTPAHQRHWDSVYHAHNALLWHHHNTYQHGAYTHDDHIHSWTAYNPAINHQSHNHHPYPGHANDSLVITPNLHHPNNAGSHHQGHTILHHHKLDSLHRLHNIHHP